MTIIDRLPPHNAEAEDAVLGSCLMDPSEAMDRARAILRPGDFYREANARVYAAMLAIAQRGQPPDFLLLSEELRHRGQLEDMGGLGYLSRLVESVPTPVHVEHYARLVQEAAQRRQLITATGKIAARAYDQQAEMDSVWAESWEMLSRLQQDATTSAIQAPDERAMMLLELVHQMGERGAAGVSSGLPDLDRALHGMRAGDLIIIAARPSIGKSALLQGISRHVAATHGPVLFCSVEMSREQVVTRDAAAFMGMDWREFEAAATRRRCTEEHTQALSRARARMESLPIHVYYSPRMTTADIRARGQEMRAKHGLQLLAVDYLQLLKDRVGERGVNDNSRIAYVSSQLKAIAGELGVPLLVASQLSREVERRTPPIPEMADLRDSGAIEQDADVIVGLYRADKYYPEGADDHEGKGGRVVKGKARLEILKQRNGPAPVVLDLVWREQLCEYGSAAEPAPSRRYAGN